MKESVVRCNMDDNSNILIVDDMPENLELLGRILDEGGLDVSFATSGQAALTAVSVSAPSLILLDVSMPGMDGYEVCARLQEKEATKGIPIIFVTAMEETEEKVKGFRLGARDYITKPFQAEEVRARVMTHLSLKAASESLENHNRMLEKSVAERTRELDDRALELETTRLEVICRLGRAAEYRDNETGNHIQRMSRYCELLAEKIGMDKGACRSVLHASAMHDVGKIGVPDSILLKPAKLTAQEWETMQAHTLIGGDILSGNSTGLISMAKEIALTHHEKWDGSGYPAGLAGKDIPVSGRIAAVCDVFDALTSDRPYKEAWKVEDAMEEIQSCSGTHFDPELVSSFMGILPAVLSVKNQYRA